jgi:DDE superfamily endonuclease
MSPKDLLLLMIWIRQREDSRHSRYRKRFLRSLSLYERHLHDRRIPRAALEYPNSSAWRALGGSGNDLALITLTGLDFSVFNWLEQKFTPIHNQYSPFISPNGEIVEINPNQGQHCMLSGRDCLGLYLAWTQTRGSNMLLQIIFGLTGTPISMYIRFARRILIKVLQAEDDAAIKLPSDKKVEEYKAAIANRHPLLQNVWCSMDGLKLRLHRPADGITQNMFYNGWTHDHYVSAVFVFCPDGTIPMCCFNVPGSIHNSKIAEWGNIYKKLRKVYERTGGICTADSAFSMRCSLFILKTGGFLATNNAAEFARWVHLNRQTTSMRQTAEWGMRSMQASFPRLKDRIVYEEHGERKLIMQLCILLHNLCARRVGINQIKSVYMESLNVNANEYFANQVLEN